jgi:asparagine synthase (glutamine-hydrolysing)
MCGIAGFIILSGKVDLAASYADIRRMTDTLTHRGPDDADYWVDPSGGTALGHRRLSIIDLSPAGRQPMHSRCGRYHIVFNGEIYNFEEIRTDLSSAGCNFRGHSDTEVLLAACSLWGVETTLKRSSGMFAFALWDSSLRTLTIARDRMGEKPLYYGVVGHRLVFASELRALRLSPAWGGHISHEAVAMYLRYGYIPAPYSIFRNIFKLPPASFLTFKTKSAASQPLSPYAVNQLGSDLAPVRYWSLRSVAEKGLADQIKDEREAVESLEHLLGKSVRNQMVADVPLGAFLSAGVDSSTVVSLMQHNSNRPVKTFTVGFEDKNFNEAPFARDISKHLGTEHIELYLSASDALGRIPSLAGIFDEPFADSSQLPTLLLSELVRRHVTVCLTGDSGDELFGGYNRYWWSKRLWRLLAPWPRPLRKIVAEGITALPLSTWNSMTAPLYRWLPESAKGMQCSAGEKLLKIADAMGSRDITELYNNLVSYWKTPEDVVPGVVEPCSTITADNLLSGAHDDVYNMFFWDQSGYLPDDNLVKVDRASMAVSLETRIPLLDHRIVEFSWRVPVAMKYRDGAGKWLLRQVLNRHVPKELMDRPKMGFSVPVGSWLKNELRDWAESLLSDTSLRNTGILDPRPVRRAWEDHLAGRRNMQSQLWTVLMLQSWMAANESVPAKPEFAPPIRINSGSTFG